MLTVLAAMQYTSFGVELPKLYTAFSCCERREQPFMLQLARIRVQISAIFFRNWGQKHYFTHIGAGVDLEKFSM